MEFDSRKHTTDRYIKAIEEARYAAKVDGQEFSKTLPRLIFKNRDDYLVQCALAIIASDGDVDIERLVYVTRGMHNQDLISNNIEANQLPDIEKRSIVYRDRYVCFLDLLGFSSLVLDATAKNNIGKISEVVGALKSAQSQQKSIFDKIVKYTFFSDCMVLSIPASEKRLSGFIWRIRALVSELWAAGYPVRGAIVKGKLHHDDVSVVGEALIRAYALESKEAIFPRVLLDIAHCGEGVFRDDVYIDLDDSRSILNPFCYMVAYAKKYLEGTAHKIPDLVFEDGFKVRKVLMDGLQHQDTHVREKYIWASKQFNTLLCDPFQSEIEGWFQRIEL